jgi:urease accessory protein
LPPESHVAPGAMSAHARLATEHLPGPDGGRTVVSELHSEAPLLLRLTEPKGLEPWAEDSLDIARVCIAAGAAGPVGGDQLRLDVTVGPGSTLVLNDISATLLLPGTNGERSITRTRVTVDEGGTFIWIPEPMIAARGSHHTNDITIDLAAGARLLTRDELLLGRHAEDPGTIHQRLRVTYADRPLYHQDLDLGEHAPEWPSPAVADSHLAVGSLLIVDPAWDQGPPPAQALTDRLAALALNGPGVLISALAPDTLSLRQDLDFVLAALGAPWAPSTPLHST